ncbi:MAG TPA: hypothetical protein VHE10_02295 [Candidatus Paceibacterota bacterium]|nr:hypothetical protein [Candidatus Paceibacterota bacterium]
MFWNRFLFPMLAALVAVAGLNWIGGAEGYYFTTAWYDWPVHFLGGVWSGLFLLWIFNLPHMGRFKRFASLEAVLGLVFLIGLAWEGYELFFGLTSLYKAGYGFDTFHDLVNDVLGAAAAFCLTRRTIARA